MIPLSDCSQTERGRWMANWPPRGLPCKIHNRGSCSVGQRCVCVCVCVKGSSLTVTASHYESDLARGRTTL